MSEGILSLGVPSRNSRGLEGDALVVKTQTGELTERAKR